MLTTVKVAEFLKCHRSSVIKAANVSPIVGTKTGYQYLFTDLEVQILRGRINPKGNPQFGDPKYVGELARRRRLSRLKSLRKAKKQKS